MSSISTINLGRVSNLMRGDRLSSALARTNASLSTVEDQLTTGKKLNEISDNVGDGSIALSVQKTLETRDAYSANLTAADNGLSEVDTNLGSLTDLLRSAQSIASANVGSDVTADARTAAASQIDSIYDQVLALGNTESNGVYLYGGDRSNAAPFVESDGGVKWVGSSTVLANQYDESKQENFMVDGASVFGALSGRVQGSTDLKPTVSADTRLADLNGAANAGVRKGVIAISNGTTTTNVDLSTADSLGDVVNAINTAAVGGITAAVNAAGTGIDLASGATDQLTVTDVGGGTAAQDLGISRATSTGAGDGLNGTDVGGKVTGLTPLAALRNGAGIDLAGLTITQDGVAKTIDLAGAKTVEDLLNKINNAGTDATAQINAAGTGIDVLNSVQGSSMSVGEVGAGTTAADLGVKSFDANTAISDLNGGKGITLADGNELKVTDSNGKSAEVDLDGAKTVQDVLDKINAAAAAAGAGVAASFANGGIKLADTAGGQGTLAIANVNNTTAVAELGLAAPASGGVIQGTDVAPVQSTGVFATLDALRDSLRNNDQTAITNSAETLDDNLSNVVLIHGTVGAQVKGFEDRQTALDTQNLASKSLLSQLQDTDFTDAIIKFQTLQTSLQATMQSASKTLNLSLMDYLG